MYTMWYMWTVDSSENSPDYDIKHLAASLAPIPKVQLVHSTPDLCRLRVPPEPAILSTAKGFILTFFLGRDFVGRAILLAEADGRRWWLLPCSLPSTITQDAEVQPTAHRPRSLECIIPEMQLW